MIWKSTEPEQRTADQPITSFVENEQTRTFSFVLDPKGRNVAPSISLEESRELAKTGLRDTAYFSKAKIVYAQGGGISDIQKACGRSPSYAQKVHAAFERVNSRNRKKHS